MSASEPQFAATSAFALGDRHAWELGALPTLIDELTRQRHAVTRIEGWCVIDGTLLLS